MSRIVPLPTHGTNADANGEAEGETAVIEMQVTESPMRRHQRDNENDDEAEEEMKEEKEKMDTTTILSPSIPMTSPPRSTLAPPTATLTRLQTPSAPSRNLPLASPSMAQLSLHDGDGGGVGIHAPFSPSMLMASSASPAMARSGEEEKRGHHTTASSSVGRDIENEMEMVIASHRSMRNTSNPPAAVATVEVSQSNKRSGGGLLGGLLSSRRSRPVGDSSGSSAAVAASAGNAAKAASPSHASSASVPIIHRLPRLPPPLRIALVGASKVGKTQIINRLVNKCYDRVYRPTMNVAISSTVLHCAGQSYAVELWDIPSHPSSIDDSILSKIVHLMDGGFIVTDGTELRSFTPVKALSQAFAQVNIERLSENLAVMGAEDLSPHSIIGPDGRSVLVSCFPVVLFTNKADSDRCQVTRQDALESAAHYKLTYGYLGSALTNKSMFHGMSKPSIPPPPVGATAAAVLASAGQMHLHPADGCIQQAFTFLVGEMLRYQHLIASTPSLSAAAVAAAHMHARTSSTGSSLLGTSRSILNRSSQRGGGGGGIMMGSGAGGDASSRTVNTHNVSYGQHRDVPSRSRAAHHARLTSHTMTSLVASSRVANLMLSSIHGEGIGTALPKALADLQTLSPRAAGGNNSNSHAPWGQSTNAATATATASISAAGHGKGAGNHNLDAIAAAAQAAGRRGSLAQLRTMDAIKQQLEDEEEEEDEEEDEHADEDEEHEDEDENDPDADDDEEGKEELVATRSQPPHATVAVSIG